MDTRVSIQFEGKAFQLGDTNGNRVEAQLDRAVFDALKRDVKPKTDAFTLSCANGVRVVGTQLRENAARATVTLDGQDVTPRIMASSPDALEAALPRETLSRIEAAATAMSSGMSTLSTIGHAASLAMFGSANVNIGRLESPLTPLCDGAKEAATRLSR